MSQIDMLGRVVKFYVCLANLIGVGLLYADPLPDPRGLFEQQFVETGRVSKPKPKQHIEVEVASENLSVQTGSTESSTFIELGVHAEINSVAPVGEVTTIVVRSLGLAVNAERKEHSIAALKELGRTLQRSEIEPGRVYLVGSKVASKDMKAYRDAVGVDRVLYQHPRKLPERYSSTRSPLWILETDQGEYLVSGMQRVSPYISQEGYFIEPRVPTSTAGNR